MYDIALFLHSWLRWVVILAGILAVASSFMTREASSEAPDPVDRWGLVFTATLDLQMLLGLLLYLVLSPTTAAILDRWSTR